MDGLKSWNDFLEPMEHEIRDCSLVLGTYAYRVDDCKDKFKGIRSHCNIRNPENNQIVKTCDYFYIINDKFFCIEFSDLFSQKSKRDKSINIIKNAGLDKSEWTSIVNNSSSEIIISNELAYKITDTDFILRTLYSGKCSQSISDLPDENYSKYFLIVYYLPNSDEVDRARFSDSKNDEFTKEEDKLKSKLATQYFAHIKYEHIYWLEIRTFYENYC